MVVVRIPQEIRKYKEKLLLGLTKRQLIASVIALPFGIATYFLTREYLQPNIMVMIIGVVSLPILAIGFLPYGGMPLDKYALIWFKYNFVHPHKRVFKSEVAFREWELDADYISEPQGWREKRAYKKWRYQASLERAALIEEAYKASGVYSFDAINAKLVTVKPDPCKEKLEKALSKTEQEVNGNA